MVGLLHKGSTHLADTLFKDILPLLPQPILWTLAASTILATAWPSARELFVSAMPWRRRYDRRKMELELLKMRYEIEALKKEHQLEPIPDEAELTASADHIPEPIERPPSTGISKRLRFAYGFLGSLVPTALRITVDLISARIALEALDASLILGISFLGLLGGSIALLLAGRDATAKTCFFAGVSSALLTQAISTASAPQHQPGSLS